MIADMLREVPAALAVLVLVLVVIFICGVMTGGF